MLHRALGQAIMHDGVARTVLEAINHIAYAMDIETIAEFVEDAELLNRLRAIGVDFARGFDVHMPEPLDTRARTTRAETSRV